MDAVPEFGRAHAGAIIAYLVCGLMFAAASIRHNWENVLEAVYETVDLGFSLNASIAAWTMIVVLFAMVVTVTWLPALLWFCVVTLFPDQSWADNQTEDTP